jgi:outer membrane protein TolC
MIICGSAIVSSQDLKPEELSYQEFVGYVKQFHPAVRQADLEISKAEAGLMAARGGFDPKLEVDLDQKQFKGTQYYSLLNSVFKIPTWYGVELKAGVDNSEGIYINPQNRTPSNGLTSLGLSVPLGQGLLINQRMADLRIAKIQLNLSKAERQVQASNVLYEASAAYYNWVRTYREFSLHEQYLKFAIDRQKNIIRTIELGDKPSIDSIEGGIVIRNRELNLEEAKLKLIKGKLELSNFLWINNVPVELQDNIVPQTDIEDQIIDRSDAPASDDIGFLNSHSKIQLLQGKVLLFNVERQLKGNMLLPQIDIGYHRLFEADEIETSSSMDYKFGLNFRFPLFLRKERAGFKLAKLKVQDAQLSLDLERYQLQNKIESQQNEIVSLQRQLKLAKALVNDYQAMFESEEKLFAYGESSLFLVNSRENMVVSSKISQINLIVRYLTSQAELDKLLATF